MARTFLGYDDTGSLLGFDLGDGGPPAWVQPTPVTVEAALRSTAAQGGDPAAVLAPRPQRVRALRPIVDAPVDPGLLAASQAAREQERAQYLAGPAQAPVRGVVTDGTPQIEAPRVDAVGTVGNYNPFDALDATSAGLARSSAEAARQEAAAKERERVAKASAGAGIVAPGEKAPPGQTPAPTGPLVPTPAQAGGAAAAPGAKPPGAPDGWANMTPAERELYNLDQARIAAELAKRPTAGTVVKGGKVQLSESWQGQVGPNADTLARMRANDDATAAAQRVQAKADSERDAALGKIAVEQATAEQRAADVQAQIAAKKQEELGRLGGEMRGLQQRIASAEVDPNKWWKDRRTGEKAAVGVALALANVGQVLTRTFGQQNPVLGEVYRQIDADVSAQIKNIDKQRGDLSDLQRLYQQTKERYGDEALAADITKQAALVGFKAQIQQEVVKAQTVRGTEAVHNPAEIAEMEATLAAWREATGTNDERAQKAAERRAKELAAKTRDYDVRGRLLELDVERRMLEKQADLEARMNGALSKQFGFTQDRVVGGSSGPSLDKIRAIKASQAKSERDALESGSKMGAEANKAASSNEAKLIYVNGKPIDINHRVSQAHVDKVQERIGMADEGMATVDALEARTKTAGGAAGLFKTDGATALAASKLAGTLAQLGGSGVPSATQEALALEAVTPGPRQAAALQEMRRQLGTGKANQLSSVGAKP